MPKLDTLDHIEKVLINMLDVIANLTERASAHDASKLEEPEFSGYAEMQKAFTGKEYGTLEYKAVIERFRPIVQHHYENNTHHPEHWPNGVADMSLLDMLEMLADWKAASDRRGDDLGKGIDYSVRRFGISDQLASVLKNTAVELGWIKRGDDA